MPETTLAEKGKRLETLLAIKDRQLTSDEDKEFGTLVEQIEAENAYNRRNASAKGAMDFLKQSAGGLGLANGSQDWRQSNPSFKPLGNGASLVGMRQDAGSVNIQEYEIETKDGKRLPAYYVTEEGVPLFDPKKIEITRHPEYKGIFRQYLRYGEGIKGDALRILQEASDEAGGYLVPEDILGRIVTRQPTPTRINGRVTRIPTSRDQMVVPKVVYNADNLYTTGIRLTWTGEIPSSSTVHAATNPVFGQERIPVYTGMLSLPLTRDMVEDTAFPVVDWVGSKFGETIDLAYDNLAISGVGGTQPMGVLNQIGTSANPIQVIHSTNANTVAYAGLVATTFAVPEQYEDNLTWTMNKVSGAQSIAALVDGQGRPLWGTGYQNAGLAMSFAKTPLMGYDVLLSGFMPNVAANAYPYIFGDWQGYYLVPRLGLSVQVLNEIQALSNQIVVLGRVRWGGAVVEDWRLKVMEIAA